MLEALIKLLSSGVELVPQVMEFINAVRNQAGLTDEQILAHARTTNDAAGVAIVKEKLRLMAEGEADNANS